MFVVQIITHNQQTITYAGLAGPMENARISGIERFFSEHPGQSIKDSFAFSEREYFGIHECRDVVGRGCCEICGGVIALSPLHAEINGGI